MRVLMICTVKFDISGILFNFEHPRANFSSVIDLLFKLFLGLSISEEFFILLKHKNISFSHKFSVLKIVIFFE